MLPLIGRFKYSFDNERFFAFVQAEVALDLSRLIASLVAVVGYNRCEAANINAAKGLLYRHLGSNFDVPICARTYIFNNHRPHNSSQIGKVSLASLQLNHYKA